MYNQPRRPIFQAGYLHSWNSAVPKWSALGNFSKTRRLALAPSWLSRNRAWKTSRGGCDNTPSHTAYYSNRSNSQLTIGNTHKMHTRYICDTRAHKQKQRAQHTHIVRHNCCVRDQKSRPKGGPPHQLKVSRTRPRDFIDFMRASTSKFGTSSILSCFGLKKSFLATRTPSLKR